MGVGLALEEWVSQREDRYCEILSPLAMRAGGEKISHKLFKYIKGFWPYPKKPNNTKPFFGKH